MTDSAKIIRYVDEAFHLDKGRLLAGREAEFARRALEATLGTETNDEGGGARPSAGPGSA